MSGRLEDTTTVESEVAGLDRRRIRELFDLRASFNQWTGGDYTDDPYPIWHSLREQAEVHPGTLHKLTGYPGEAIFQGLPEPDRPHFTAMSYAACDEAFRDPKVFASAPPEKASGGAGDVGLASSMLMMGGQQHRRYRKLVQPSFVMAKGPWWVSRWVHGAVHTLIDQIAPEGRAELNVDLCAAIPVLTITGSFGIPVEEALNVRERIQTDLGGLIDYLAPIVAARRKEPADDLITVLVQAEITEEDGSKHRLSDAEIYSFAVLLLAAGSGTTWKQMGITIAALLERPALLEAVRRDRSLLRPIIDEAVRWTPTDPMFSRYVTQDVDFHGVHLPRGAMLHLALGAANRDPERWENPDEYDPYRKAKPHLGFGGGPHVCLGMHVARGEIVTAIEALLDRLPNLRLDPDAEQPRPVGLYERGIMQIPVLFDAPGR